MPWDYKKEGNHWAIVRADTGEVVGHSDSEEMAKKAVAARYANTKDEGSRWGKLHRTLKNRD